MLLLGCWCASLGAVVVVGLWSVSQRDQEVPCLNDVTPVSPERRDLMVFAFTVCLLVLLPLPLYDLTETAVNAAAADPFAATFGGGGGGGGDTRSLTESLGGVDFSGGGSRMPAGFDFSGL